MSRIKYTKMSVDVEGTDVTVRTWSCRFGRRSVSFNLLGPVPR